MQTLQICEEQLGKIKCFDDFMDLLSLWEISIVLEDTADSLMNGLVERSGLPSLKRFLDESKRTIRIMVAAIFKIFVDGSQ
jgi:hypothetical protein